jgi:hypothetical protein
MLTSEKRCSQRTAFTINHDTPLLAQALSYGLGNDLSKTHKRVKWESRSLNRPPEHSLKTAMINIFQCCWSTGGGGEVGRSTMREDFQLEVMAELNPNG